MLDHIILTVQNLPRAIAFYEAVLPILGIATRFDHDGKDGPPGHPDLKGFGAGGRMFLWLKQGKPDAVTHVGLVARSKAEVDAAHAAAIAAGAAERHPPGPQLHYDPRYYAAQVTDPDGHTLEFVYKSWQHPA